MDFIEPCFGIGHSLSLICQMTSEDIKHQLIIIINNNNNNNLSIRGNSAADSAAAKNALDGDISDELIPFSDLKSRVNKHVLELRQSEWDEFPENKLLKIIPKLKDCFTCPGTNKRRGCDISTTPTLLTLMLLIPFC